MAMKNTKEVKKRRAQVNRLQKKDQRLTAADMKQVKGGLPPPGNAAAVMGDLGHLFSDAGSALGTTGEKK